MEGMLGYTDLFATVEWEVGDGCKRRVGRTPTVWTNSVCAPVWEYECPEQLYPMHGSSECNLKEDSHGKCDRLVLEVFQEQFAGLGPPLSC